MTRFVDPKATRRFTIPGPCECPGKPHESDWIDVRSQLSGTEQQDLNSASPRGRLMLIFTAWNLLDANGEPVPLDEAHVGGIFGDWFDTFQEWWNANLQLTPLPNASAVPSPASTQGNGSQTQTQTKAGPSTTSSSLPVAGVTTTSGAPPPPS